MRVFPDLKVLLPMPDPESWVKSARSTIFKRHIFDPTIIFMFWGLFTAYLGDPWLMFQAAKKCVS